MPYCETVLPCGFSTFAAGARRARLMSPGGVWEPMSPRNVLAETIGNSDGLVRLSWQGPSGAPYSVFVDGALLGTVRGTSVLVPVTSEGEPHVFEVLRSDTDEMDAALPRLTLLPPTRARLSWTRPAGVEAMSAYRVYQDSVLVATVPDDGESYFWLSEWLLDGVEYEFEVRSVDAAGNESAPTTPIKITLRTIPNPVQGIGYTYSGVTKQITITGT